MRARTFAVVGLVVGLGASIRADDPPKLELIPFASSAGKYKAAFPGPVKTETTEVKTPAGPLTLTLDSVELPGGILFMVTYVDATEEAAKQPAAGRLDKVRDANKGPDGKLLNEKDLELMLGEEKLPARELLIEKRDFVLRNRVVIAGRRLYQVMLQGSKESVTSPTADKFFESFEVTK